MGVMRNSLIKTRLIIQGKTLSYLNELSDQQWLDKERIKLIQRQKIQKLLLHAYNHVPYYQKILQESQVIDNKGYVNLKNFTKIPFLEKDTLRDNFEWLKSNDLHKRSWYENTSGGSTGEPTRFIQDQEYSHWSQAIKILFDKWSSYELGDRKIRLWGSERDLLIGKETIKTHISRFVKNELWLNAFRLTNEQMSYYVKKINSFRPKQILAYVESIYEFARFIERNHLPVYSPNSIMVSAGTLYDHMRDTIERVFNTPVFNRYGSREVGDVACECEYHKGLHVLSTTHYVEIIKPDGTPAKSGEVGEIVVTPLINYAMPLVRYRIGDMGSWAYENCICGRGLPMLQKVTGRTTDVFYKRDGSIIVPEYLIHMVGVVLFSGWIRKFQVIQEDYELVRVLIVLEQNVHDPYHVYNKEIKDIVEKFQLVLGAECKIEVQFVENINPSKSGKYRYTITKVK